MAKLEKTLQKKLGFVKRKPQYNFNDSFKLEIAFSNKQLTINVSDVVQCERQQVGFLPGRDHGHGHDHDHGWMMLGADSNWRAIWLEARLP